MKADVKERVYLLIIIFCVVMCAAMIVTMITGGVADRGEEHIPVNREIKVDTEQESDLDETINNNSSVQDSNSNETQINKPSADDPKTDASSQEEQTSAETSSQVAITEEYVNEQLGRFLPSAFPVQTPSVDIGADGVVTLNGRVNRDKLKNYLKDLGVDLTLKYSVALLMLPKEFDAEVSLLLKEGENNKFSVQLKSATLDEKDVTISLFPQKVTDVLSNAVNGMVAGVGEVLEFSGFEDGAIILQKS